MAQMQKDYEEAPKQEDEGWAKLIAGGALAVTAIGLMVFSGGMATPLVVAGSVLQHMVSVIQLKEYTMFDVAK